MKRKYFKVDNQSFVFDRSEKEDPNRHFIEQIETDYCFNLSKILNEELNQSNSRKDKDQIATLIRTLYYQSIEQLLSLIFAILQAPHAVSEWLQKYRTSDLKALSQRLTDSEQFDYYKFVLLSPAWVGVSRLIFQAAVEDGKELEKCINGFAKIWKLLAADFSNSPTSDEYNQIKHGFRISKGGFSLKLGIEKDGKPPTEFHEFKGSQYGSSFSTIYDVRQNRIRYCHMKRSHINWDIEMILKRMEIISISLSNCVSFMKGFQNNGNFTQVEFNIPDHLEDFEKAALHSLGVSNLEIGTDVDSTKYEEIDEKRIKDFYLSDGKLFILSKSETSNNSC